MNRRKFLKMLSLVPILPMTTNLDLNKDNAQEKDENYFKENVSLSKRYSNKEIVDAGYFYAPYIPMVRN